MRFIKKDTNGQFTTLVYALTWPCDWEMMLCYADAAIRQDFCNVPKGGRMGIIETCMEGDDNFTNHTQALKDSGTKIKTCEFAKQEWDVIRISGHSAVMDTDMRISFKKNNELCIIQMNNDKHISVHGEHAYDKFADSLEILGHVNSAKKANAE